MPSSDTDHSHGGKVVSDDGGKMFAVGKGRWRMERKRIIVVCEKRRSVPCRSACHGNGAEELYKWR